MFYSYKKHVVEGPNGTTTVLNFEHQNLNEEDRPIILGTIDDITYVFSKTEPENLDEPLIAAKKYETLPEDIKQRLLTEGQYAKFLFENAARKTLGYDVKPSEVEIRLQLQIMYLSNCVQQLLGSTYTSLEEGQAKGSLNTLTQGYADLLSSLKEVGLV